MFKDYQLLIIILFFWLSVSIPAQEKLLFTYIDYSANEVRSAICDADGNNVIDLAFGKSFLPVWMNDKVILSTQSFIRLCDTAGLDMQKIGLGYRASVSNKEDMFAFYNKDGIIVYDSSKKFVKQIEVEPWTEVTITWSNDDSRISFYELKTQLCKIYDLKSDSIFVFGSFVYHPLWNRNNNLILYNKQLESGLFGVFITSKPSDAYGKMITSENEMCVVPGWSNKGDKIAFLRIRPDSLQPSQGDMYISDLVLYDLNSKKFSVLADDAGFTDQAFPQFSFDSNDEYIFYTAVNKDGNGVIKKINISTLESEVITKDFSLDHRLPVYKNFNKKD